MTDEEKLEHLIRLAKPFLGSENVCFLDELTVQCHDVQLVKATNFGSLDWEIRDNGTVVQSFTDPIDAVAALVAQRAGEIFAQMAESWLALAPHMEPEGT